MNEYELFTALEYRANLAHSVRDPPANKGEVHVLSHEASDCYKICVILQRRKLANPVMHKRIKEGLK